MSEYFEQNTPTGLLGVEIKWMPNDGHFHCSIWRNPWNPELEEWPSSILLYSGTVDSLDHYVETSKNLGILIPQAMIDALLADKARNFKGITFLTPAEYDALPLEKRIADAMQAISKWEASGYEAGLMGDRWGVEQSVEMVSRYEAILAKLVASKEVNAIDAK